MEEPSNVSSSSSVIDPMYEFSAPQFYDFMVEETVIDVRLAELWFDNAGPYAPSPFMPRIKASRSVQHQILCDFGEDDQLEKAPKSSEESVPKPQIQIQPPLELVAKETEQVVATDLTLAETKENVSVLHTSFPTLMQAPEDKNVSVVGETRTSENESVLARKREVCTPAPSRVLDNKKAQTAKKIASMIRNPSAVNSKIRSQAKSTKPPPASAKRETNVKNNIAGTPNVAHENRAIKKQKLEGGKTRQILTVNKAPNLPHKTKSGLVVTNSSSLCSSSIASTGKLERKKMYVREPAAPFVSTAEMMKKFQSSTRDLSLPCSTSLSQCHAAGALQRKPTKLTLTRPKTPEFETSQRVRSVKIKSSAELEEEMLANMPKFKARPVNKKIFEAPTVTHRSTPQLPEFKEFHLKTMSRANHNAETSTVASVDSACTQTQGQQNHQWNPHHLTAPKSPRLQTLMRARPPKIKSSEEIEKEQLEQIPQFKARPLNRKILESKGDMGVFSNLKKQVTIPQEFRFEVDKRIPPPNAVVDLFDKLSIHSESHQEKHLPRNTTPNPFHLHTEERGAEKEKRLAEELMQKKLEEERARVPKAHPYPYTTDYPVVPPKPEPKPCTRPEPFQLESLVRHEEEVQREMEEKRRMEMEEAQMRIFKAQPVLKEDPIPLPEKPRMPLTEVQEFDLHVNHRAADRAEFDKKIKEKEMMYKRYRDEAESARMMEEEKALKQLRRTLVPHAKPVPKFDNPFLPQKSSKGTTKAKSPKLLIDYRKQKRRIVYPASSAPASHMR